jgi:hypothetical protein
MALMVGSNGELLVTSMSVSGGLERPSEAHFAVASSTGARRRNALLGEDSRGIFGTIEDAEILLLSRK